MVFLNSFANSDIEKKDRLSSPESNMSNIFIIVYIILLRLKLRNKIQLISYINSHRLLANSSIHCLYFSQYDRLIQGFISVSDFIIH